MQNDLNMMESWSNGQSDLQILLERQQATLLQTDDTLREQRIELERMLEKLDGLQEALRDLRGSGLDTLVEENDYLRHKLADRENVAPIEPALAMDPNVLKELDELQAENKLLRQFLDEKEQFIQELREQEKQVKPSADRPAEENDLVNYEAELNRYRKQLAEDRAKLNAEIEQLRMRNEEQDEAMREMEMELSRERAEIARERSRLDRMRDEIRNEAERVQRDGSVRASLAPLQRLREQLNAKK